MERAGADDLPEDAERQGLGTPATRASILEKLVQMGFVERKGKQLLPTKDGHMEQVLRYYEDYINKLCIRTLYDSNGIPYVCVDEYMKHRLEIKLIHSIIVALK